MSRLILLAACSCAQTFIVLAMHQWLHKLLLMHLKYPEMLSIAICLSCFVQDHSSVLLKPSSKGFSIVVEFLLQNGADPNIADEVGIRLLKIQAINVKVSRVTFAIAALTGYCRFTCL